MSRAAALLLLAIMIACAGPSTTAPAATSRPAASPSAGALGASSPAPSAPPAPESITYGYTTVTANYWGIFIAQARGYFEQQGIVMDDSSTGSAANAALALVSGSIDMVAANPDPIVRSIASGSDIAVVGTTFNPSIYELFGAHPDTTVASLRGQTLSVGGPKDVSAYLLRQMLGPNGLRPGDYDLIYAGSTPDRLRHLETGAVAATLLTQPFDFVARREGYPLLLDSSQYVKNLPSTAIAVTRGWLADAANHARLVRWMAAAYRGSQDLCDPAQKDAVVQILADKAHLSADDARQTYDLLIEEKHSAKCDLRIQPDELQAVIDYIAGMGDLTPPLPDARRIVDESILDQAIASLRQ